ncbi:MAG: hypothetical protein KAT28_04820 [Candidatus Aenigmarchaeota archaeon]|nr:hypothetical protein [Candidatus Aenigmarchaeota archaeon]
MHFFDKFFKKPQEKQIKNLNFDEIGGFIEDELGDKKQELMRESEKFRERLVNHLNFLETLFGKLLDSDFEPVILQDKRDISNIVETSKKNYCSNSEKLIVRAVNSLKEKPKILKIKSIVLETFNKLNKFSREALILLQPFEKDMKRIALGLKKFKKEIDKFESFINSDYSLISDVEEAESLVCKINHIEENKIKSGKKEIELEGELEKLKKEIKAQNLKISEIASSEETNKLAKLEKQQKEFESQTEKVITNITQLISNINRQIKGYIHTSKPDKKQIMKIEYFLDNPETLLQKSDFFEEVVKNVKNNIDKIEPDEKKRKKFLSIEKNIKSLIKEVQTKHKEISGKLLENIGEIKKLKQKVITEEFEKNIEKLTEKKELLEEEKKNIKIEGEGVIKDLLNELEKVLASISNKEITINKK